MYSPSLLLLFVTLSSAKQATVKIPDPGGLYIMSYPEESYTTKEITAITRLSPLLKTGSSYPVNNQLDLCVQGDLSYRDCGSDPTRSRFFERNAEVNINRMRQALKELDAIPSRNGLSPVIDYERMLETFYLDVNEAMFKFMVTQHIDALRVPIAGLNPQKSCSASLASVASATSQNAANRAARYDWYNCLNSEINNKLGPYPLDAWHRFLEKADIKEEYVPTEDD